MCVERPDGAFDIYTGRFIQFHQIDNSRRKIVEISDPDLVGMTYSIPMVFNGGKFSGQGVTCLSLPAVTLIKVTFLSRTYQEGQEQITMSSPDQALFSEDVRKNCAGTCVLTGVLGRQRTEAAHIKPRHAGGEPDVTNGILLRSDIHIGIYCLAGIIRGNRVKIPKEQDMPCTLQLTMIYVGITFFLIVGYICHQIT